MNGTDTLIINEAARERDERIEKVDKIDFKMVTFSLSGKDYGVDIMKVKEIAKYTGYTYVPNSAPYVRGVYNLRGDIISVIDLRTMFNLPVPERTENFENGLILRLSDSVLGIVVDNIDKVVGISSADIQPPHPIFSDVNIKYISGVVENSGRLYIILNVEKIFSKETETREAKVFVPEAEEAAPAMKAPAAARGGEGPEKDFIVETLRTFKSFHAGPVNSEWVGRRYREWKAERNSRDLQITSAADADAFLATFYSPDTGRFWRKEYAEAFAGLLGTPAGKIVNVWNPGCGRGFETYSLTVLMSERFAGCALKVWANDSDLLAISTAPNLVFSEGEVPEHLKSFVVAGKNGLSFSSAVKDRILFEYHDVLNASVLPEMDVIVARDLVSFLKEPEQKKLLDEFHEKLKPSGLLFLGTNEQPIDASAWMRTEKNGVAVYKKNQGGVKA